MRIYVGFDDTDRLGADQGTGKLARWFADQLPEGCALWGVVRQQLLVDPAIPYTSHNSAACVVLDGPDRSVLPAVTARAVAHLEAHALEGSDPGLCVVAETDQALARLSAFGRRTAAVVVTQEQAQEAAAGAVLSGHGGTRDGIIGAAAAVGLTAEGWSGRFIEYGRSRQLPNQLTVADLEREGILVTALDRDAPIPLPDDVVDTRGWIRPRLWGGRAVLPVMHRPDGYWVSMGEKRGRRNVLQPGLE